MKNIIMILGFLLISYSGFTQNIEGVWNGNLEVQSGRKILFIFKIALADDNLMTEIAIPSQGVKGLNPTSTTFEDGTLSIDATNLGFKYSGKFNPNSGIVEGTFYEGVNAVPLMLTKEKLDEIKPNRPQEPVYPLPYVAEEVKFNNLKHSVSLAGTLTLPISTGTKPPVVILISGSGPQDRNESFAGHKPFLVLADHLTRKGIAVLRYDDRGYGESTGNFSEGTTADFASDVLSAITYLKGRTDIDVNKIGLIGHSEGAIIAPMVANQSKEVAFIVMLAGTGTTGKQVSFNQSVDGRSFPVADEKQFEAYVQDAIDIAASNKETSAVIKELTAYYQNSQLLASLLPPTVNKDEFIENLVSTRTTPWIRYFYNYNPVSEISKIKIPALALYGSNDTQVPPKYHLQPVKDALAASKSGDYEVVLLDGLNHLFQESKTGLVSEYSQIEHTFSNIALEKVSTWVLKQAN